MVLPSCAMIIIFPFLLTFGLPPLCCFSRVCFSGDSHFRSLFFSHGAVVADVPPPSPSDLFHLWLSLIHHSRRSSMSFRFARSPCSYLLISEVGWNGSQIFSPPRYSECPCRYYWWMRKVMRTTLSWSRSRPLCIQTIQTIYTIPPFKAKHKELASLKPY